MNSPQPLSACCKGSFAYYTVKDRLPIILTRIIDQLCREKYIIGDAYGKIAIDGCKKVVGKLSQLKNEMQTNKSLVPLQTHNASSWLSLLTAFEEENGSTAAWFTASWILVECYFYARVNEAFYQCESLKGYDPFSGQKQKALLSCLDSIEHVSQFTLFRIGNNIERIEETLSQLLQVCLWANQFDLSISAGKEHAAFIDIFQSIDNFHCKLIADDVVTACKLLTSLANKHLVLVVDNAGLEFVSDLCLLVFLTEMDLISSVDIHIKADPWFISDVTDADVWWTLDSLSQKGGSCLELSSLCRKHFSSGTWKVKQNSFWTTGYCYPEMKNITSTLYDELCNAGLVIFKGDLNYRKLVSDLNWPTETPLSSALMSFHPAPLLIIRTVKGGPVVALPHGTKELLGAQQKDWNETGHYGVIQLCIC